MTNAELIAKAHQNEWPLVDIRHWAEIAGLLADALERAERERDEAVAREAVLREALQDILDWQNGSPLPSYETGWKGAYDHAQELLASPSAATQQPLGSAEMHTAPPDLARCGAYAESWEGLDKPKGWLGCSLPKGHEGYHRDKN